MIDEIRNKCACTCMRKDHEYTMYEVTIVIPRFLFWRENSDKSEYFCGARRGPVRAWACGASPCCRRCPLARATARVPVAVSDSEFEVEREPRREIENTLWPWCDVYLWLYIYILLYVSTRTMFKPIVAQPRLAPPRLEVPAKGWGWAPAQ